MKKSLNFFIYGFLILNLIVAFPAATTAQTSSSPGIDFKLNSLNTSPKDKVFSPPANVSLQGLFEYSGEQDYEGKLEVAWYIDGKLVKEYELDYNDNPYPLKDGEPRSLTNDDWDNVAKGKYEVKLVLDPGNKIMEIDETNNELSYEVSVGVYETNPQNIDFALTYLNSSPANLTFAPSANVNMKGTFKYTGSEAFTDTLWVSWYINGNLADRQYLDYSSHPLNSGDSRNVTLDDYENLSAGSNYTVKLAIDSENAINEVDETNNTAEYTVMVRSAEPAQKEPSTEDSDDSDAPTTHDTNSNRPLLNLLQRRNPRLANLLETYRERIQRFGQRISDTERQVVLRERPLVQAINEGLVRRLAGRILLQVQERGEAWYVDPETEHKFYLKDGTSAYNALNALGLGISDDDLAKIPVGLDIDEGGVDTDGDGLSDKFEEAYGTDPNTVDTDGDGYTDKTELQNDYDPKMRGQRMHQNNPLIQKLKGRILLQVQNRGQAWYLNPENGKRYFLKDGEAAYKIMRMLSLGITNQNLREIPVGELE